MKRDFLCQEDFDPVICTARGVFLQGLAKEEKGQEEQQN